MNTGINFSADGPIMEGTWQNMETGDVFEVRDYFIQDGVFTVQATDGRIFDYNTLQNYIKVDKPMPITPKRQPKKLHKELPTAIQSELEELPTSDILEEDMNILNGKGNNPVIVQQTAKQVVEDDDIKLINRVLSRVKTSPTFTNNVEWEHFPTKQLDMLIEYMGVPVEKICNYYIDRLSLETIRETLSELLVEHINRQLQIEDEQHT